MTSTNDPSSRETKIHKIEEFLQTLLTSSGLDLKFQILACNGQVQTPAASPEISVEFTGPDTPLLTERNAELLHAVEHLAAKVLRLEPDQHDRISFDAENFKLLRNAELELIAQTGTERVRATGHPFAFPPMNSRERRLLHLALSASGLPTASTSDGPRRFVVLYPEGHAPAPIPQPDQTSDRTRAIRNTFRRR